MRYFAYGSNMSLSRLRQRTPSARRLGLFRLASHDLRFHKCGKDGSGKCDAFETGDFQHFVLGALFQIDPSEKEFLDHAEGLGYGYHEKWVTVTDDAGMKVQALTYYATSIDDSLKPYSWYLNHVVIGARETVVPASYVARIEASECIEDSDMQRDKRERAVHG